jgi:hypothetical protein
MLFSLKKMAKKAPKLSKNHDLQETHEICKKRLKISQALLKFRSKIWSPKWRSKFFTMNKTLQNYSIPYHKDYT